MNIKNFQSALTQGGVRTNLFIVEGKIGQNTSNKTRFLVKAASLPPSTLGTIPVPYAGRQIKIPGDRTFEPWTISVMMDGDYELRNKFEAWSNLINQYEANTPQADGGFFTSAGSGFNTVGAFPSDISSVELSYDSEGIGEFSVTMQYQYWLASSGQGSAGDKTPVTDNTTGTEPENAF